jgi:hypothetical protein
VTLYVESNFVLEIALGQEESVSAERLLAAAERGDIQIALPAFALSEPFSTVTGRVRERGRLADRFDSQMGQLARSVPHRQDVAALRPIPNILALIDGRERDGLARTVERMLGTARRIETDLAVFRETLAYQGRFGLEAEDAIILAAVVADLRTQALPGPHCFATRDTSHFGIQPIQGELAPFDCTMLFHFADACGFMRVF